MQKLILCLSIAAFLGGCAQLHPMTLPDKAVKTGAQAVRRADANPDWNDPGVVTQGVASITLYRPHVAPPAVLARTVEARFEPGATLQDLSAMLGRTSTASVIIADGSTAQRAFYLPEFRGSLGDLLAAVGHATNTWFIWRDGAFRVQPTARLSVTIPQEPELAKNLAAGLKSLGLQNAFVDWQSGLISVRATPDQYAQVRAYLERMTRNAAVINLQVAVVGVSLSQNAASGINWNQLQIAALGGGGPSQYTAQQTGYSPLFGSNSTGGGPTPSGMSPGASVTPTSPTSPSGVSPTTVTGAVTSATTATTAAAASVAGVLATGGSLTGALFGNRFSFTGLVDFLQNYGTTRTQQSLMLKTVGGNKVKFKSVTQIPYVSGVSVSSNVTSGASSSLGGTTTATADDGIEVAMLPTYDATNDTVTVDMKLAIKAVVAFNQLSAGNQIGSLTQPTTSDHSFNDMLKLRPGQTVVVGGMTYDSVADNRGVPLFLQTDSRLSHKSLTVTRQTMFIVLRPTVMRLGSLAVHDEDSK